MTADVTELLESIRDLGRRDQIFGFITKSKTNPSEVFVVFRRTRENAEWWNNFQPKPKLFSPQDFSNLGEVRNGFNLIYTAERELPHGSSFFEIIKDRFSDLLTSATEEHPAIQQTIDDFFNNDENFDNSSKIFITGHSLGAGLATLAALHIAKIAENKKINPSIQLYTFASPRVGDEKFASHFDNFNKLESFRIINSEDLIQSVPLPTTEIIELFISSNCNDNFILYCSFYDILNFLLDFFSFFSSSFKQRVNPGLVKFQKIIP